jgi:chromosome segregation ATPase
MSNSFWEPEVPPPADNRDQPQIVPEKPAALAVSADDFAAIEERIYRAVELVKQGRQVGATAEARIAEWESRALRAETQLQAQGLMVEQLEKELSALRRDHQQVEQLQNELSLLREEREQVRQRMERLLKQLDALEL